MNIEFATLDTCHSAKGVVVVIDVCRAFTTAAYAFGASAGRILLAGTVEEAVSLRARFPGSLIMGEVGGLPVPQFDFWNSPSQMNSLQLPGKTIIQRTSAGTQGIIRSVNAEHLLAGSFAVAGATVRAVQRQNPRSVTFVITGVAQEDPRFGQEDRACAEYMAALLRGKASDLKNYLNWESDFHDVHRLDQLPGPLRRQFEADLALCLTVDRWPWALPVRGQDGLLVMEKEVL